MECEKFYHLERISKIFFRQFNGMSSTASSCGSKSRLKRYLVGVVETLGGLVAELAYPTGRPVRKFTAQRSYLRQGFDEDIECVSFEKVAAW